MILIKIKIKQQLQNKNYYFNQKNIIFYKCFDLKN